MDANKAKLIAVGIASGVVLILALISMKTGMGKEFLTAAANILVAALSGFKQ